MAQKKSKSTFAKKSFGQNFLVDDNYIDKIIAALSPQSGENVVEIGPGRGALTEKLLETGAVVTAIELERDMLAFLSGKFKDAANFNLVEGDALKVDFADLIKTENTHSKIKLVANLPYYISTAILQKLIEKRAAFSEMILMFQLEVVERVTARPGNKERGFLTVFVEAFLESDKLFEVPPSAFRPEPKVRSAVVRLVPKEETAIGDEKLFRELISAGFAQKRKTILNNLKNAPPELRARFDAEELLRKAGIESLRRAETLTLNEWIQIVHALT
jgi:16S rRNA (adenine1518-N6/adenine1519-N6)-dimethyltransferase